MSTSKTPIADAVAELLFDHQKNGPISPEDMAELARVLQQATCDAIAGAMPAIAKFVEREAPPGGCCGCWKRRVPTVPTLAPACSAQDPAPKD